MRHAPRLAILPAVLCVLAAPLAARADAPAPTYPRTVHRSGQVCLEYLGPGAALLARCRPEHGTWAEAGPPVPLAAVSPARRAEQALRLRTDWLHRRTAEWLLFGLGVTLTVVGVAAFLRPDPCAGKTGLASAGCGLGRGLALEGGGLALGTGAIMAGAGASLLFVWDVGPKGLTVRPAGAPPPAPGTAPR